MRISDWSSDVCSSDLKLAETLADARLDDVLEVDRAEQAAVPDHRERRAARTCDLFGDLAQLGGGGPRSSRGMRAQHRIDRTLPDRPARDDDARQARLRSEERRVGKACVSKCSYT